MNTSVNIDYSTVQRITEELVNIINEVISHICSDYTNDYVYVPWKWEYLVYSDVYSVFSVEVEQMTSRHSAFNH